MQSILEATSKLERLKMVDSLVQRRGIMTAAGEIRKTRRHWRRSRRASPAGSRPGAPAISGYGRDSLYRLTLLMALVAQTKASNCSANASVHTVRGNHDRWILQDKARHIEDAHSLAELSKESLSYLTSLPTQVTLNTTPREVAPLPRCGR